MRAPTNQTSAPDSGPLPPPTPARSRTATVACALIGLLCSAGVIMALLDPSLGAHASGVALPGTSPEPAALDDGFVPPTAKALTSATPTAPQKKIGPAERSAREARADAQIEKLIAKIRAEREARKAARREAHGTSRCSTAAAD